MLQATDSTEAARAGARATLVEILEGAATRLHPLMPFITEEIWQKVAPFADRAGPSVMVASYPLVADFAPDEPAEKEIAWVQQFRAGPFARYAAR